MSYDLSISNQMKNVNYFLYNLSILSFALNDKTHSLINVRRYIRYVIAIR